MKLTKHFTLIELLVVVAIIVLLVAMLMPMLDSVRERSVTIQCLSNMRQQALGHLLYCADFNQTFKSVSDAECGNFYTVMKTYVGSDSIWKCPGAPASTGSYHSSLNPMLDLADTGGWTVGWGVTIGRGKKYIQLSMIPRPDTTGMYFERIQYSAPDLDQCWFTGYGPPRIAPNWNTDYGCWPFHTRNAMQSATFWLPSGTKTWFWPRDTNVARIDGSARTYPWIDLKQGVVPPLSNLPGGYSGAQFPRAYLITGYAPNSTNGGWLGER